MSACRSCGASIVWSVSATTGKRVPLDAEPRPDGNIELDDDGGTARYVDPDQPSLDGRPRYVSHFASCPHASDWRRP